MRVRRGFAGEERWRKAGIAGESPKSPKSPESFEREREAAEITKKKGEGFLFPWIPTDTGSSVFRRYI